ncbi:hypothetical protein N473_06865 [Pseudoalteromonas luteoviolacea CPMOR-1]|uniref:Uncharacterized protein n=1 Tax=Pseudoalteromonas luteoviolacea CPMOR-1 TaxID=1365248 RepID=A0A167H3P1_9GAMM|nr:hypothetical protein [Pseudoalteromonas luteoviolacea]KZN57598.1 hypothetical protein N473_06865 [Pseudoalteromonas luteoviolacea CPMOR-1]
MKLINKKTRMIEFDGPHAQFRGISAYTHANNASDFEIIMTPSEQRDIVRTDIENHAGDYQTILGTTADTTQILLYEIVKLCSALNSAQSLDDVRKSAQSINDKLGSIVADVDAGTVKFAYIHKGQDTVINEIKQRSTAVTDVLIQQEK